MNSGDTWPLDQYLPAASRKYCLNLALQYSFQIKVVAPRTTKLGDYRFHPRHQTHSITINENLNPYEFLVVYLHEVAHCVTTLQHGIRVRPHGKEWKRNFQNLIEPLLSSKWLPQDITEALGRHLLAPKAASCIDVFLTATLRKYNAPNELVALQEISENADFSFRGRQFRRQDLRRTRIKCRDLITGKLYLISKLAQVSPVVR